MQLNQEDIKLNISHDIIFIMDKSGSMTMMGNEPLEALNDFVKEQQQIYKDDTSTFSLWTFSSTVTNVINNQRLQEVEEITEYVPRGMTALDDAIGTAITTKLDSPDHKNVICVILTDGNENCSEKFDCNKVRKLIDMVTQMHNWKFVYLAANQDARSVGTTYGFDAAKCADFDCEVGGLAKLTRETSRSLAKYRTTSRHDDTIDLTLDIDECVPRNSISKRTRRSRKTLGHTPVQFKKRPRRPATYSHMAEPLLDGNNE